MFGYKSLRKRVDDLEKLVSGDPNAYKDLYKLSLRQRANHDTNEVVKAATVLEDSWNVKFTVREAVIMILEKLNLKIEYRSGTPAEFVLTQKQVGVKGKTASK